MSLRLLVVCSIVLLCGCAVRPAKQVRPLVPAADMYQEAPGAAGGGLRDDAPWWRTFHDSALDRLVTEALASNLDLKALRYRIEQANAIVRQAGGRLFPAIDAAGSYQSRWESRTDDDSEPGVPRSQRAESSSLGALFDWEIDVWGRLRAARSARRQEYQAIVQDWLGGRLLLSASVAETYFEIVEQRQQLRLLNQQIEVNETLLSLTKLRFGQGQSSIVDVLQQQEQAEATRALVPSVQARLAQLEYAMDVLTGRAPGHGGAIASDRWEELPPLPPTGVPSDLLVQRPDLAAAKHRAAAIDFELWEAMAARLPAFSIGGAFSAVGDPGLAALVQSAFASATAPVFDAGIRRAEVRRRRAAFEEAVAEFSSAYLSAIQDVESALIRERKQSERIQLLENQLRTAQRLLNETRHRYTQGLTDYLPVLDALVTEQNLQRDLLTSRRLLLSLRVTLHRALGGPMPLEKFRTEVENQT